MQQYQIEFIEFAMQHNVLSFGEFTLKSGRVSPYFFNSSLFNNGHTLACLGRFYAKKIVATQLEYDMFFGPAYKGIPLTSAVAISFANDYNCMVPYCFNRKEAKNHGEGGITFGAPLNGKVIIIDDVISAGTSVALSVSMINVAGAKAVGAVVALDRQEKGNSELSAVQEVEQNHQIKVMSIITLDNMIEYLTQTPNMSENLEKISEYRATYGIYQP